jgi:hypothetical protein
MRKTTIDQLPVELDRPWIDELRDSQALLVKSTKGVVRYFNRAFELKQRFPHDPVWAYAVARLHSLGNSNTWEILTDLLCQCALTEPGAIEQVVTLLQENTNKGSAPAIDSVIQTVLTHHTDRSFLGLCGQRFGFDGKSRVGSQKASTETRTRRLLC